MRVPRVALTGERTGVPGKWSVAEGRLRRACGPWIVVGVAVVGLAGAFSPAAPSGWSAQPTPNSAGTIGGELDGVSCTSATACTAVGLSVVNSAGLQGTLAERWDGSRWSAQPTPNPAGATGRGFGGVSCTSATACTAVGSFNSKAGKSFTLVERWDG
jgi:hypothetical protein